MHCSVQSQIFWCTECTSNSIIHYADMAGGQGRPGSAPRNFVRNLCIHATSSKNACR